MDNASTNPFADPPAAQGPPPPGDAVQEEELLRRYNCKDEPMSVFDTEGKILLQETGSKVIMKRVLRSSTQAATDIDRDITVRSEVLDPSILLLIESLELRDVIWTVNEYRPLQTIGTAIRNRGPMSDPHLRILLNQLCSGIASLFMAGFAHLRICDQTICIDGDQQLIITDFQYACKYSTEKTDDMYAATREKYGNDIYVAPEVFASVEYNARKAVMWSCGVLIYFITTGQTHKLSILDHPSFDRMSEDLTTTASAQPSPSHFRRASAADAHHGHQRKLSTASTQSKFLLALNRTSMPNYARWVVHKMLAVDPVSRPELIEVATRIPKEYSEKTIRPLMELVWLDYKSHVGPLAGFETPEEDNADYASSIRSFTSAVSNPFRSLLGKGDSSRRQSTSGW